MDKTSAAGNVAGLYVDDDPGVPIVGTLLEAADRNALQTEILNVIINSGLTPSAANLAQLWGALIKGAGSLIDADKLDSQEGSYYRNAGNLNAGTLDSSRTPAYIGDVTKASGSNSLALVAAKVLEKLLTVDGYSSGITSEDSGKVGGYELTGISNRWGVVPLVATDGVMEIGKILDFHESDSDSGDKNSRIYSESNRVIVDDSSGSGSVYHSGNLTPLNVTESSISAGGAINLSAMNVGETRTITITAQGTVTMPTGKVFLYVKTEDAGRGKVFTGGETSDVIYGGTAYVTRIA